VSAGDGTLYLLCFAPGLHVTGARFAKHYLGYVHGGPENVDSRLAYHLAGRGSPLVKAAVDAGLEVELVRTWAPSDRDTERRLKRQKRATSLCPACSGEVALRRAA
jgi:hypothetical protein